MRNNKHINEIAPDKNSTFYKQLKEDKRNSQFYVYKENVEHCKYHKTDKAQVKYGNVQIVHRHINTNLADAQIYMDLVK